MLKKIIVVCIISILLLISVPTITSDSVLSKSFDEVISNESMSQDGLADNVTVSILGPSISISGIDIFRVTLAYKSSYKIYYELFVNVTKNNGSRILFENKFNGELHGDVQATWLWWRYLKFLFNGHPFGHFDINVTLKVTNDGSIKMNTAHGYLYLFFIIPWAVIEEN